MRLRFVKRCSFRKSELTNFQEMAVTERSQLKTGDCVMLLSLSENQLVFVYGFTDFGRGTVLRSERLRLSAGTWDPLMLAEYAAKAGIELDGLKRFEEHYRDIQKRKTQKTAPGKAA